MTARPVAPSAELTVLGEHHGLLFVDKPSGLQTEPDARQRDTLVTRVAAQLRLPSERVHALSRLDTGVSGVVTLGLTSEARRLVHEWRERGTFQRRYLALATGSIAVATGSWCEPIGRAQGQLRSVTGRHPEPAHTDYAAIATTPRRERAQPDALALLALAPRTGRTHQLRVHASAHGLPLIGDRAYGGVTRLISPLGEVCSCERIALHAAWVELPLGEPLRFSSKVPAELTALWLGAGGAETDFEAAASSVL